LTPFSKRPNFVPRRLSTFLPQRILYGSSSPSRALASQGRGQNPLLDLPCPSWHLFPKQLLPSSLKDSRFRNTGGHMAVVSRETASNPSLEMLEAFASVGAQTFDLTLTDLQGQKIRFRKGMPLATLRQTLPSQVEDAVGQKQN